MPRRSPSNLKIDPNVRCLRIYPTEDSSKTVMELKTVGIKLSREQAIHLANVLLAASQMWDEIDLTAYRRTPRKSDHTYQLTVTTFQRD